MTLPRTTLEDAVAAVLQPPSGSTVDRYGMRSGENQESTLRAAISSAFSAEPELAFSTIFYAAADFQQSVETMLEQLQEIANLAPLTQPEPSAAPTLQRSRQMLQGVSSKALSTSAGYAVFKKEVTSLLQHHAQRGSDLAVAVSAAESRRRALQVFFAVRAALTELENRSTLLAGSLLAFQTAPVEQHAMDQALRNATSLLPEDGKVAEEDVLRIAAARTALEVLSNRRQLRDRYALLGTVAAEPHSDAYPAQLPELLSRPGPFFFEETLAIQLTLGTSSETLYLYPSAAASFEGMTQESYAWITDVASAISGPYSLAGTNKLQVYYQAADGARIDATVSLTEALLTTDDVADELNSLWAVSGLENKLVASNLSGDLRIQALEGSFAIGTGSANVALSLNATGGLVLTDFLAGSRFGVAGPYNLTSLNNTFVFLADNPDTGTSILVETVLPTGGAVTASAVATAIDARLVALGLDGFYDATTSGSTLVLMTLQGSEHRITTQACSAGTTLGFSPGVTIQGTDDVQQLSFELNSVPLTANVTAGTYSADSLRDALEAELGADYDILAVGVPGSRTLSMRYLGTDARTATLEATDTGGMAGFLGFLQDIPIPADSTRADVVAAQLRERCKLARIDLHQSSAEELLFRTVDGQTDRLRVYRSQGTAQATSAGFLRIRLELEEGEWDLAVDEMVYLVDGPQAGTYWTVLTVEGAVLTAVGTVQPEESPVTWEAGPTMVGREEELVRILEGSAQGDSWIVTAPTPFEITLSQALFTTPATGTAFIGEARVRLTGVDRATLQVSSSQSLSELFSTTSATPKHTWLRSTVELPCAPLDLFEFWSPGTSTTPVILPIEELSEDRLLLRVPEGASPTFSVALNYVPSSADRITLRSAQYALCAALLEAVRTWSLLSSERARLLSSLGKALYAATQSISITPVARLQVLRAVADVVAHVTLLHNVLSSAPAVQDVSLERLLDLLGSKGGDLAVEYLKLADFTSLFSEAPLNQQQDALAQLAEVMRTYLPRESEEGQEESVGLESEDNSDEFYLVDE